MTGQANAEGNTITFTHDLKDRETSQTNPDGGILTKAYDRNGNFIQEVFLREYAERGEQQGGIATPMTCREECWG